MARKLRVEYPGAIYHVMNRGDRREPIFLANADRQRFVQTLAKACAKTACLCVPHPDRAWAGPRLHRSVEFTEAVGFFNRV